MEMLDKRLNDKGKNWRHVFKASWLCIETLYARLMGSCWHDHEKALTVLDYLLHAGSENVVIYFKDNIYIIK